MKKIILSVLAFFIFAGLLFAEEIKKDDPSKLFYLGNSFYEKRDYAKAIEEYKKVLDAGHESGSLYYNLGNSFFKTGKLGYAILFYKKAQRLMPQDRDLTANLSFALSLVTNSSSQTPEKNLVMNIIKAPFMDLNINALAIVTLLLYICVMAFLALFILSPFWARKTWVVFTLFFMIFLLSATAFGVRYYDEVVLSRAIVIQKDADCKYEPIEKSTTYYRLQEGDEAIVLSTRSGWCKIKRLDGKIAWIKKDALEEI